MINEETVFILGAGASTPYRYPTGKDLRERIIKHFPGEMETLIRRSSITDTTMRFKPDEAKELSEKFEKSSTQSVDLFISRNKNLSHNGKMAIVIEILKAEKRSLFRESLSHDERKEDWYFHLYNRMTATLINSDDYQHFSNNKVTFITFNYDRSLEHFFWESLCHSFPISEMTTNLITSEIKKIPIYHVYGKIYDLDWENSRGLPYAMDFEATYQFISEIAADKIQTIYEIEQKKERLDKIKKRISEAEKIFFFGFGYANENLKILNIPDILNANQRIYGTAMDFFPNEIENVKNILREKPQRGKRKGTYLKNIEIEPIGCCDLLRKYL